MIRITLWFVLLLLILGNYFIYAKDSEVIKPTPTRVIVREHPGTSQPYVSIVSSNVPDKDPFLAIRKKIARPDYRMLDPKVKSGQIPYEGPYSDRKKVYILAATLATVGAVGGAAGMALAPAAASTGAAGGAGVYAAGGAAVVAGTAAGTVAVTKTDPDKENFIHESQSKS